MENAFHHGYDVRAADGFNDWDAEKFGKLVTGGAVIPSCYPEVFTRYRDMGGCPAIFCGPVEVDPSLIERAAKEVQIFNAPLSAIVKSRSHDFLKQMATDGITLPATGFDSAPGGRSLIKASLVKEFSSAGGVGVTGDVGQELRAGQYRQQAVEGLSVGATFLTVKNGLTVINGGDCSTAFVGITEHINRLSEFAQSGYLYGGLIYPAEIESGHVHAIKKFGERAAAESGLTGWWGADFILTEHGACLLEINPRFPASAELIAQAHDIDLVSTQISATTGDKVDFDNENSPQQAARYLASLYQIKSSPFQGEVARSAGGVLQGKPPLNPLLEKEGKIRKTGNPAASREELQVKPPPRYTATAVCYAKTDCVFNDAQKWFGRGARDIPHDGQLIQRGEPIISLYATAKSSGECLRTLKELAARLYSELNCAVCK